MTETPTPPVPALNTDLSGWSARELLRLSGASLAELRRRGIVRTGNAPAGDLAELLVARSTGGSLAPNSQKSWDVLASDGMRLQVKARVVLDVANPGERQLSAFRSWEFDRVVIVLFDEVFAVRRAASIPVAAVRTAATYIKHTNSYRVMAKDPLLDAGDDWTQRLSEVSL